MDLDAIEIGKRIKNLRVKHGMSQEQFAETIDTSTQTISSIENGKVYPNTQTLAKINEEYLCTIDSLLGIRENISGNR